MDYQGHELQESLDPLIAGFALLLNIRVVPEMISRFQVARYNEGGYYDWHMDQDLSRKNLDHDRKMSIVISLSSCPEAGIELEGSGKVDLNAGDACAFSGLLRHRAPAQKSGTRYSLAIWVPGPTMDIERR